MSEIDDIFGGSKKKASTLKKDPIPPTESTKKSTKRKPEPESTASTTTDRPKKSKKTTPTESAKPKPTSVDDMPVKEVTSAAKKVETVDFRFAVPAARPAPPKKMEGDVDDGFADSRGTSSSSKRTDDGLRVFYNTDLQIGTGNGDTAQCPFECWCCY
ncbi:hypothetical protein HDU98_011858 [Podochytrium sp. JEL0797]|nr:hypothetical protein HDU98_011858 [Podochytrium sp. JEL0797]